MMKGSKTSPCLSKHSKPRSLREQSPPAMQGIAIPKSIKIGYGSLHKLVPSHSDPYSPEAPILFGRAGVGFARLGIRVASSLGECFTGPSIHGT